MTSETDKPDELELCYGLVDGSIQHISQVKSGLNGNCLCPKCGGFLIAKKGDIRKHHFAHYNYDNCQGAQETALHLLAKEILYEEKRVYVPGEQISQQSLLEFDHVILEVRQSGLVFDALGYAGDQTLGIEIKVTHEIDDWKREIVINQGMELIEIDLSGYLNGEMNRDEIKEAVVTSAPRYWINQLSTTKPQDEEINMDKETIIGFKLASGYSRKNQCDFVSNKLFVLGPVENKSTPNYRVAACGGYGIVNMDITDNPDVIKKLSGFTFPAEVQLTVEVKHQRNKLRPFVTDVNLV